MKVLPFVLTLAAGAGLGAALAGSSDSVVQLVDPPTREAVAEVKRRIVDGHRRRDAAALAQLYADDYTAIDGEGKVRTKAELLAGVATDPEIVEGRYDLLAVRRIGSIAVATGRGHLRRRNADGTTSDIQYDSFNVFELRDGRWLYVAAFLP